MRFLKLLALAMGVGVTLPAQVLSAAEEEPRPEIRAFDFPTLEALGQAMFGQDRLAWVATDMAISERGERTLEAEGMRGWITITDEGRNIVRFVRMNGDTPEAFYDVVFMEGAQPQLYSPATPVLTPEEVAQYNARMLALENIDDACSETYNTIALRDPESANWLVWAIAATTEPDVLVVGGHYRFTVAEDGSEIVRTDRLYRACLSMPSPEPEPGYVEAFVAFSHITSLTPIETHVFMSLSYGDRSLVIGTNDGRAWKVEGGMISAIEQDDVDPDGAMARSVAGMSEGCSYIVADPSVEPLDVFLVGDNQIRIIHETENVESYRAPAMRRGLVASIGCRRLDIVPALNDYKVVVPGYHLLISDGGEGRPNRNGTLEYTDGQFRFEITDGEPLDAETQARIDARLAGFREAMADAP
jgi:hypothetical protein